jgi:hypothetical protein
MMGSKDKQMRFQPLTLLALCALFLVACNDDVPSNRYNPTKEPQVADKENVTVYSGIHRERGTAPITYNSEILTNSEGAKVRAIPDIRFDDEGGDEKNVTTRTFRVRPDQLCGTVIKASLKDKIADCLKMNGEKSSWNGTIDAGSAESLWVLVTLAENSAGENYEVWMDMRTRMLWSDLVTAEGNWCQASGSILPASEHVGEDCAITGKGASLCTNYNPAELPKVSWRLPTRHDYLQADIDGIRFVLLPGTNTFWTATASSDVKARDKAWSYNMRNGTLVAELMSTTRHVRCIGTPNF